MEKRVATNLAALRRRRNAIVSLIRALEEYSSATRSGAVPRKVSNFRHKQAR